MHVAAASRVAAFAAADCSATCCLATFVSVFTIRSCASAALFSAAFTASCNATACCISAAREMAVQLRQAANTEACSVKSTSVTLLQARNAAARRRDAVYVTSALTAALRARVSCTDECHSANAACIVAFDRRAVKAATRREVAHLERQTVTTCRARRTTASLTETISTFVSSTTARHARRQVASCAFWRLGATSARMAFRRCLFAAWNAHAAMQRSSVRFNRSPEACSKRTARSWECTARDLHSSKLFASAARVRRAVSILTAVSRCSVLDAVKLRQEVKNCRSVLLLAIVSAAPWTRFPSSTLYQNASRARRSSLPASVHEASVRHKALIGFARCPPFDARRVRDSATRSTHRARAAPHTRIKWRKGTHVQQPARRGGHAATLPGEVSYSSTAPRTRGSAAAACEL